MGRGMTGRTHKARDAAGPAITVTARERERLDALDAEFGFPPGFFEELYEIIVPEAQEPERLDALDAKFGFAPGFSQDLYEFVVQEGSAREWAVRVEKVRRHLFTDEGEGLGGEHVYDLPGIVEREKLYAAYNSALGKSNKAGYTGRPMGDETAEFHVVAAQEDFSPVELRRLIDKEKAAKGEIFSHDGTARATATPRLEPAAKETTKRGPRVKPHPALPKTAPEIYRDRQPREELGGKKENIVQFIERVYAPWREIITRPDLRRLDETADEGVGNWISYHKKPLPNGLLPTEFELNTAKHLATPSRRSAARRGIPHRHIITPLR